MPIPSDLKSVFWSQARRPVASQVGPDLGVDYEQRDHEPNQRPHSNADEDEARVSASFNRRIPEEHAQNHLKNCLNKGTHLAPPATERDHCN